MMQFHYFLQFRMRYIFFNDRLKQLLRVIHVLGKGVLVVRKCNNTLLIDIFGCLWMILSKGRLLTNMHFLFIPIKLFGVAV